jgi:carbonic anhydrase/acetyltransferase-like protein (isoleucine patch superfamily)
MRKIVTTPRRFAPGVREGLEGRDCPSTSYANHKYRFTGAGKTVLGNVDVWRIASITGELGGWITSEDNLSFTHDCWVAGEAVVCDKAIVTENARVYGTAIVSEEARIGGSATVRGSATVSGAASIKTDSVISGCASVYGCSLVASSRVEGFAKVLAGASVMSSTVRDAAVVDGNARLNNMTLTGDTYVCDRAAHPMTLSGGVTLHNCRILVGAMDDELLQAHGYYENLVIVCPPVSFDAWRPVNHIHPPVSGSFACGSGREPGMISITVFPITGSVLPAYTLKQPAYKDLYVGIMVRLESPPNNLREAGECLLAAGFHDWSISGFLSALNLDPTVQEAGSNQVKYYWYYADECQALFMGAKATKLKDSGVKPVADFIDFAAKQLVETKNETSSTEPQN